MKKYKLQAEKGFLNKRIAVFIKDDVSAYDFILYCRDTYHMTWQGNCKIAPNPNISWGNNYYMYEDGLVRRESYIPENYTIYEF